MNSFARLAPSLLPLLLTAGFSLRAGAPPAAAPALKPPPAAAQIAGWKSGCAGGDGAACHVLAALYRDGRGVPRDAAKAEALDESACAAGEPDGCFTLARLRHNGEGGGRDDGAALALLTRGLAAGESRCRSTGGAACESYLAVRLAEDGAGALHEEITLAQRVTRLSAGRCVATAPDHCLIGARRLRAGEGVTADPAQAAKLAALGCEGGDGGACHLLAQWTRATREAAAADALRSKAGVAYGAACAAGRWRACVEARDGTAETPLPALMPGDASGPRVLALLKAACLAGEMDACAAWPGWAKSAGLAAPAAADLAEGVQQACRDGQLAHCKAAMEGFENRFKEAEITPDLLREQGPRMINLMNGMLRGCRAGRLAACGEADLENAVLQGTPFASLDDWRRHRLAHAAAAACQAGDLPSCEQLEAAGWAAFAAAADTRAEIESLFTARCRGGDDALCLRLHQLRLEGWNSDPARVAALLRTMGQHGEKGCAAGRPGDCELALLAVFLTEDELTPARTAGPAAAIYDSFESGRLCPGIAAQDCALAFAAAVLAQENGAESWKRIESLVNRAPALLDKGCQSGDGTACMLLAQLYQSSLTDLARGEKDFPKLERLVNHLDGVWNLKPDPGKAEALAKRGQALLTAACQSGDDPAACAMREKSDDDDDDGEAPAAGGGRAALVRKCADGRLQVCDWLASDRADRLDEREMVQAIRDLDDACAAGSARSCLRLAMAEATGRRLDADELAAAGEAAGAACARKIGAGCRQLLSLAERGWFEDPDHRTRRDLLEKGCKYGDRPSCHSLGIDLAIEARTLPGRLTEALKVLDENCGAGFLSSCQWLSYRYRAGTGGFEKNVERFRYYLQKSCDLGDAQACKALTVP